MMIMTTRLSVAVLACAALGAPMSAAADQGAIAGGVVAATSIESNTEASVAGTIGYRVNRFVAFGVEVTAVPVVKSDPAALRSSTIIDSIGSAPVLNSAAPSTASASDGRAAVFTTNVRIEFPAAARLVPYLVGGGGVANVKDSFTVAATPPAGVPVTIQAQPITQSSTGLALTAGGGVSFLAAPHVSVDLDVRYLRMIANRDLNIGRVGVGFSYRF